MLYPGMRTEVQQSFLVTFILLYYALFKLYYSSDMQISLFQCI